MSNGGGLAELVGEFLASNGALSQGVSTPETLAGGPPSVELERLLPGAKAAVSFALPLNQELIAPFLAKKDFFSHNNDNLDVNTRTSGLALDLASLLTMKGYPSLGLAANLVYRTDTPHGIHDELPEISHRYLAARSGVGFMGFSGNLLHPKHGAAVILGSLITTAPLEPTAPLPAESNYCDQCGLCLASCASGLMHPTEKAEVALGGEVLSYSRRRTYMRCDYVCGGFAGLHPSGRWSTWSPARFAIPAEDSDFLPALKRAARPYAARPRQGRFFFHAAMPGGKGQFTCGNCQLVCHPDPALRRARHKLLVESGVIIQEAGGGLRAVSPEQAREHLASLEPERRALYQED